MQINKIMKIQQQANSSSFGEFVFFVENARYDETQILINLLLKCKFDKNLSFSYKKNIFYKLNFKHLIT